MSAEAEPYQALSVISSGAETSVLKAQLSNGSHAAVKILVDEYEHAAESETAYLLRGCPFFVEYMDTVAHGVMYELAATDLSLFYTSREGIQFLANNRPVLYRFLIESIDYLQKANLAHRRISQDHVLVFCREGQYKFKLGSTSRMVRTGPSSHLQDIPSALVRDFDNFVVTKKSRIPPALWRTLPTQVCLGTYLYHMYNRDTIVNDLRWIDMYSVLFIIRRVHMRFLPSAEDAFTAMCTRAMEAATYADCKALWDQLANVVKEWS